MNCTPLHFIRFSYFHAHHSLFFSKSTIFKEVHLFTTNPKKYKLFNEDNISFMKKLPNSSIDLILTDPPYNLTPFSRGNIHLKNGRTIHNNIASWDTILLIPQTYRTFYTYIKANWKYLYFHQLLFTRSMVRCIQSYFFYISNICMAQNNTNRQCL